MTTARDICNSILRKLHILGQGQVKGADELNIVLDNVNDMLATWSVEGSLVYTESSDTFSLTSGKQKYTIGTGQDFESPRMLKIRSAYVSQGGTDYSLKDYDQKDFSRISQKASLGIPDVYYFNGGYPSPEISFYPVPSGALTVTLNSIKPLSSFSTLDTVYEIPPEYKSAIIYNGAMWCAADYEREPTRSVSRLANSTKKALKVQNMSNDRFTSCLGVPGSANRVRQDSNIYRGW